ncbi:zincin-like metallopeptidase domain-containing protein [Mucilaginibacter sp. CSA2-8R]|uniref:ArdC family protein n=1 Tax=Mucilaginibacter sp. CSA2-8R TaxID=3141542 RepID=UPI00315D9AF8
MATYTKNKPANGASTTFKDTYQEVTDAVIQALEEGTVIWQCPWNSAGLPKNITTGIQYRGWNLLWLNFHSSLKGYTAPYYITYKQAQHLGGTIKKGQSGTKIIYWATIELKGNAANSNQEQPTTANNDEKPQTRMVPKVHTVFNIDQTEGIVFPEIQSLIKSEHERIEACEQVVANMPNPSRLITNGSQAFYTPVSDTVVVPSLQSFNQAESYYSTLFHELAHSTGHQNRLNRKELVDTDGFGKTNYAKEELTAEMTAAFLCAITGIQQSTLVNSAAYIQNWLKALRNDKTLLIKAAAQAQRASDYILDITNEAS